MTRDCETDVLVVGAGLGGYAAALAAVNAGYRVILTEETDWIGGQLTAQAVPPDEHGWIEQFGCTAAYRRFRDGVRTYYRNQYPIAPARRNDVFFYPGGGWVSPLCHEPRVALAVLQATLASHVHSSQMRRECEHDK
jgi:cation diffusion facilitator CzcD-associated flavoprotein CzcO